MAVYTEVRADEADALLQRLGLGALTDLQGIGAGVENTNYYASTARGQWVLTLFERLAARELPYYLQFMQHLAEHGIPVPAPQAGADGSLVHLLAGKPAAVVTRLPGSHRLRPEAEHCAQLGQMLARLHAAGASFAMQQPHLRGLAWWTRTAPEVWSSLPFWPQRLLRWSDEGDGTTAWIRDFQLQTTDCDALTDALRGMARQEGLPLRRIMLNGHAIWQLLPNP